MLMSEVLVDTDTIFYFLKGHKATELNFKSYVQSFGKINMSVLSYDEITETLTASNAIKQLNDFTELARYNNIIPLTVQSIEIAAGLYSEAKSLKNPFDDISILIAAICLENDYTLITRQPSYFGRISSLKVSSWDV